MNMNAIILDTETHVLNGLPLQVAYIPCSIEQGGLKVDKEGLFDQLFSVGESICYSAMAVHHVIESDLVGMPPCDTFAMPYVEYVIGHNIKYDLDALARTGADVSKVKPICTLALAKSLWPDAPAHTISTLSYFLSNDHARTRELLKNAHNAKADILLTARILQHIVKKLGAQSMEELHQHSEKAKIPTFISFGKYKGTALENLPADYVTWLLRQDNLDPYLKDALLNRKEGKKI